MLVLSFLLATAWFLIFFCDQFDGSFHLKSVKKHVPIAAIFLTDSQRKIIERLKISSDEVSSKKRCPLLVFVNTKSGGQTGELLLYRLRSLLGKDQVYDLISDKGPEKGLNYFKTKDIKCFRVVVCGGDGSITWVLNKIEETGTKTALGVLPLGTGNDLARVLGWGNGSGQYELVDMLTTMSRAKSIKLDRWNVKISNVEEEYRSKLNYFQQNLKIEDSKSNKSLKLILSGYLGIGVDAQICLNFHLKRERQPHLFTSQFINKFWYASSGANEIVRQRFLDFSLNVSLVCDGKLIKLPVGIEGIIVFNIRSYGGGVDLWGEVASKRSKESRIRRKSFNSGLNNISLTSGDDTGLKESKSEFFYSSDTDTNAYQSNSFAPSSFNDGLLEVVGVQSSFELAASQVGLAKPIKLCQGKHILIHVHGVETMPVQVDGEPFILKDKKTLNKVIEVTKRGSVDMLTLLKKLSKQSQVELVSKEIFEDVVAWARKNKAITETQAEILEKEYNSRLQVL